MNQNVHNAEIDTKCIELKFLRSILPLVIGGAGAVVLLLVVLISNPALLKPSETVPPYDPTTLNGNLTDAQLVEKAKDIPIIGLFVGKYPNAKVEIKHSWEIIRAPPITSVLFEEDRHETGDPDDVYRSLQARVTFNNNSNSTGYLNIDCYHFGTDPHRDSSVQPEDYRIFILNDSCF